MNSPLPKTLKDLFSTLANMQRLMKKNGETNLSANSFIDRFAQASGYKNKRALEGVSPVESEQHSFLSRFSEFDYPQEVLIAIEGLSIGVLKPLVTQELKDTVNNPVYEDGLKEILTHFAKGSINEHDALAEYVMLLDEEDDDSVVCIDSISDVLSPFLVMNMAYFLSSRRWHYSTSTVESFGYRGGTKYGVTCFESVEGAAVAFVNELHKDVFQYTFFSLLQDMALNVVDGKKPAISPERIEQAIEGVCKELFSSHKPEKVKAPF